MFSAIVRTKVLVLLALLLLPLGLLHAQSVAPNTHAVLIGIDSYADAKIKPRQHAEADVKALHALITAKDYLGADPKNVHLLLTARGDKEAAATRKNIRKALGTVLAKA